MADCTFDQQIEAYHDGELPPEHRLAVERHLATCPACTARLAQLEAMSRLFASALANGTPRLSQIGQHRLQRRISAEMDRGLVRLAGTLSGIAAGIMLVGSAVLLHMQSNAVPKAAPPWIGVSASAETDTLAHDAGTPAAVWYLADASQTNEP